jgi:hypothetical protein
MNKLDGSLQFVNLLGLIVLFINLQVHAQGGGTQTTLEQVNQAVRETQKLCENQMKKVRFPVSRSPLYFRIKSFTLRALACGMSTRRNR